MSHRFIADVLLERLHSNIMPLSQISIACAMSKLLGKHLPHVEMTVHMGFSEKHDLR